MPNCVEKIAHSCGSSSGLQVFEAEDGSYNGYCYSCGTYVPDPYKDKPVGYKPTFTKKTEEDIEEELEEINECPTLANLDRKLSLPAMKYFGVKTGLSEKDGKTPTITYFPYTREGKVVKYKAKLIAQKKMWAIGDSAGVDLFGWEQAIKSGSPKLYITEGEEDAIALMIILKKHQRAEYKDQLPAVVSLPNGAGNAKRDLSKLLGRINKRFQNVVLVFDQDKAGEKAVEEVLSIAPKWLSAELPCSDANACLIEGHSKAAFNAIMFRADKPKNTRIVSGKDLIEAGRVEAQWGVSYPWEGLTSLTRGIRKGETIYLGSGVKMGKSEVVNALADHLMREHKWKVFLAKPEEANAKTFKLLVGKAAGCIFQDPTIPFNYEEYDKWAPAVAEKVYMVNLYQHLGWETLKGDIISAVSDGCEAVIIDPITSLMPENAAEANEKLQEIAKELAAMAMDLDIVIFIFCHLKAPTAGEPHERGGKVLSSQFAGSRAMMRSCNYMIGMEGNKDPDLSVEERNYRDLVVLEDREFGNTGKVELFWDRKTGLFNEV